MNKIYNNHRRKNIQHLHQFVKFINSKNKNINKKKLMEQKTTNIAQKQFNIFFSNIYYNTSKYKFKDTTTTTYTLRAYMMNKK